MAPGCRAVRRLLAVLAFTYTLSCAATVALAQQSAPSRPTAGRPPSADEQAIRAGAQTYSKAYNAGDAKALAALWTADGEYTDEAGRVFQGRAAIEQSFAAIFASQPGVTLDVRTESIRFLSPDVAIETGSAWSTPAHGNPTTARYNAVLVKRDGNWLLASVSDSARVAESNSEFLRGLEWLIGQWQAEQGDERLTVKVEWTANKNFLQRSFATTSGNKPLRSGTQIIGWDPRARQIVSWHFDSDGGYGHERWNKQGSRWFIESQGILRDGGESTATNILAPIDANSFTWLSTDRTVNGAALPETAAVKLIRVATPR